jgi:hypothetical protein
MSVLAISDETDRAGGCQCGAVRFSSTGEARGLYVCHCLECRRQSASAFGMSLVVPREGFRLTRGQPQMWSRSADSGRRLQCFFCPDCGARVWHEPEEFRDIVVIKAGALDEPIDAARAIHIWTARKLPGIVIPEGAPEFPGEPD